MDKYLILPIVLVMLSYIGARSLFCRYLRRVYPEVWNSLGQPGFLNTSMRNSWRLGNFMFFSREYKKLNDKTVGVYLILLRMLAFFLVGILIAGAILSELRIQELHRLHLQKQRETGARDVGT
jgi:hypothetical protein